MDAFNQSCETMKKNIAKILSHSFTHNNIRRVVKKGYFTVRLTVS